MEQNWNNFNLLHSKVVVSLRSTFAVDGASLTVNEQVEKVIKEFRSAQKPIGYAIMIIIIIIIIINSGRIFTDMRSMEVNILKATIHRD